MGPIVKSFASTYRQTRDRFNSSVFYRKNKKFLSINKTLAGSASGKSCFVLATGPSINSQDISKLKGELVITISNFFVHKDFQIIAPEYHMFASSHDPITDAQMVAWLQDAEKHFKIGQKIFMSAMDRYMVEKHNLFTRQKVYYYSIAEWKKIASYKTIDFAKQLPAIGSVSHLAMYLAIFLGAQEINLLGVDHTPYFGNETQKDHFYENEDSALFRTGYRPRQKSGPTDVENTFRGYIKLWEIYKGIKKYADARGVQIINLSHGSTLDVFPRKNLIEIAEKIKY